jgi:putative nucleotidyltransferase with HDIG domain
VLGHVDSIHAATPLLLAAALLAQFAADAGASALREAVLRGTTLRERLQELWICAVDAALAPVGLLVAWTMDRQPWSAAALLPLIGVISVFARERRARVESLVELNDAYQGMALVLGDVVEHDDGYTGEHCRDVVALALAVGDRLGLSADRRRNLEFAALLHDVGKVAIPKAIINKPGRLDPEEFALIKTHTIEGQRMLDRVGGFMSDVGRIVRWHHERWDGGGYPDGLAGEDIPLEARIITVCDSYNAMTTNRAYREALPPRVAIQELRECSGGQFDPVVVAAVLAVVEAAPAAEPPLVLT